MKRWTQGELDAMGTGNDGILRLEQGDFRGCKFHGRNRVLIGDDSILGNGVQLGIGCAIGKGTIIGEDFCSNSFLRIGENCHFGKNAHVGFGSRIGEGSCFAAPCYIEDKTTICEGVELPQEGTIYGVSGVDGKTFFRMGPLAGRSLYAFEAVGSDGQRCAWAGCTGVEPMPLPDFIRYTGERAKNRMRSAMRDDTWERMHTAATFLQRHFARESA